MPIEGGINSTLYRTLTTEYRTSNTSPTEKMQRIDDREVLSGAAMIRVERVEAGAGANLKI